MARVKGAMMTRKRRNKVLKLAKATGAPRASTSKMANEQVMKSLSYAYTGRRLKKRDFPLPVDHPHLRRLQDERDELLHLHERLKKAGVEINRKMLAELAVNDKAAFTTLTELAKSKLA